MEDDSLYPRLLKDTDVNVKSLAKKYISEMGGISRTFITYLEKWKNAKLIEANTAKFTKETKQLFNVLAKRIERENNELYKAVDNAA